MPSKSSGRRITFTRQARPVKVATIEPPGYVLVDEAAISMLQMEMVDLPEIPPQTVKRYYIHVDGVADRLRITRRQAVGLQQGQHVDNTRFDPKDDDEGARVRTQTRGQGNG